MIAPVHYITIAAVIAAFILAAVVARIARSTIHGIFGARSVASGESREAVHQRAEQLARAFRLLAYLGAAAASVSIALARLGVSEPRWNRRQVAEWFATHGINVVVIVVGSLIVVRAANLAIERLQYRLARRHADVDAEWQRRAATLGGILTSLVTASMAFIAILMVLRELTIDVLPLLTGAGIAGLAIGFGAQNLVRDVISGFFLILEDQVRVGDIARINGVGGVVEQINLRTIALRDAEGAVQVFPNGMVTALANLSKQFAYAVVDLQVAYDENIDRVFGTAREVGASMEKDANWGPLVLAPLDILGIESLEGGAARFRVRFKTLPLNQGRIANELRRRMMTAFVGRGIRPYAKV